MARVKPKRHPVVVDMTAMCDVAWLLLTFFILTTTFKKPDVEQIKPPSSVSEKILPDASLMTINSTAEGHFYFQPVENGSERLQLLEKMREKFNLPAFTDDEKNSFVKVQAIGVPMSQLKSFLDLPGDKQKDFKSPTGIPMDSTKRELVDWVEQSLAVNPEYKLAVKGDVTTEYPKIKYLFEGLRDIKFNNFWLITSAEKAPEE